MRRKLNYFSLGKSTNALSNLYSIWELARITRKNLTGRYVIYRSIIGNYAYDSTWSNRLCDSSRIGQSFWRNSRWLDRRLL